MNVLALEDIQANGFDLILVFIKSDIKAAWCLKVKMKKLILSCQALNQMYFVGKTKPFKGHCVLCNIAEYNE